MGKQENQKEKIILRQQPLQKLHDTPFSQTFTELIDFRHLIFASLLHPIEAFNAYLPQFKMFGLFGGKTFAPKTDIPDLAGKVILVTGGRYLPDQYLESILIQQHRQHRTWT